MDQVTQLGERRTTVDDIFDLLHEEILSLRLRPGDKIVNERSKLTRLQHLILTRLSDDKAPRRAALI